MAFDTFADVFHALDAGKADAALAFTTNISEVAENYTGITYISQKLDHYSYGFGTQKNREGEKLMEEMNVYFRELKESGKMDLLKAKWEAGNGADCMEEYSFDGITVIPFCTSASSGIGRSGSNMETLAGSGTWLEGERFSGSVSEEELQAWIEGLE